jgi:hypothetical protein
VVQRVLTGAAERYEQKLDLLGSDEELDGLGDRAFRSAHRLEHARVTRLAQPVTLTMLEGYACSPTHARERCRLSCARYSPFAAIVDAARGRGCAAGALDEVAHRHADLAPWFDPRIFQRGTVLRRRWRRRACRSDRPWVRFTLDVDVAAGGPLSGTASAALGARVTIE